MNFPIEKPFFQFVYWLVDTPGLGGIAVALLAVLIIVAVALTLRWIVAAGKLPEPETYSYPTPALHHDSSR